MSDFSIDQISRRQLLKIGGVGLLAAFLDACAKATEANAPALPGAPGPTTLAPAPTTTLAGVGAGKGAPPQTPSTPGQVMVTPTADFYTVAYRDGLPDLPSDWKLSIAGNVDKPLTFSLEELMKMPVVEEMRTFECISNPVGGPLISNGLWKAVRLRDLLEQANVKPNTIELKLDAFDGYHTSIPLDLGMQEESLLAYGLNGDLLPLEHGKPLRCMWPGRYGMKQPKWIEKITAITEHHVGFWEGQGWSNEARVLPNSRIDVPEELSVIRTLDFKIKGVGFSSDDGVAQVEVSYDDGKTWQTATLVRGPNPYTWTNWEWSGPAPAQGQATLLARLTTNRGDTQKKEGVSLLGGTFPNGTSAIHSVVVNFNKG